MPSPRIAKAGTGSTIVSAVAAAGGAGAVVAEADPVAKRGRGTTASETTVRSATVAIATIARPARAATVTNTRTVKSATAKSGCGRRAPSRMPTRIATPRIQSERNDF